MHRHSTYALLTLFVAGCVPERPGPRAEVLAEAPATGEGDIAPLLNATLSFARPEVGRIQLGNSSCTATLIGPQTLVTAAHCMDYRSAAPHSRRGSFLVELGPDDRRTYVVQGWQPLTNNRFRAEEDVGLVRLMTPVPATVATPAPLATRAAVRGEGVTLFGYGCTSRGGGSSVPAKRSHDGAFGFTRNLCSGDSGGPVFIGANGPLGYVNSGYIVGPGNDLFGEVVPRRSSIAQQQQSWATQYGVAAPGTVEVVNETRAPLYVRCDAPTEPGECDDWRLFADGERRTVATYAGYLSLYNVGLGASVRFEHHKARATSAAVAVRPSAAAPLVAVAVVGGQPPPDAGVPVDAGTPVDASTPVDAGVPIDAGTSVDAGAPVDAGTPVDAGSAPVPPTCLGGPDRSQPQILGSSENGTVCAGRSSWFRVTLDRFEFIEVRVDFSNAAGDIDAKLVDANGRLLAFSAGRSDRETVRYVTREAGDVWLRVYGFDRATTSVAVTVFRDDNLTDADGDGVPDALDLCDRTPIGASTWMSGQYIGCSGGQFMDRPGPQDDDGDGVENYQDRCSGTAIGAPIWLKPEYVGCAGGQRLDR